MFKNLYFNIFYIFCHRQIKMRKLLRDRIQTENITNIQLSILSVSDINSKVGTGIPHCLKI